MSLIMVDIEADGPIPGDYSMICLGAVIVEPSLSKTFYGELRPISKKWIPQALAVSGFTRFETMNNFENPEIVMREFKSWIARNTRGRPEFISDNNGFDYMFVCWYFWHFLDENIFGHTSRNLNDLYKGIVKDMFKNFKHLRRTKHDHHPVNDAKGNAEALLKMKDELGLNISLE